MNQFGSDPTSLIESGHFLCRCPFTNAHVFHLTFLASHGRFEMEKRIASLKGQIFFYDFGWLDEQILFTHFLKCQINFFDVRKQAFFMNPGKFQGQFSTVNFEGPRTSQFCDAESSIRNTNSLVGLQ